jgi:hypothetical protein
MAARITSEKFCCDFCHQADHIVCRQKGRGRLSGEQIALYLAARISRAGDAMPALARAGWAIRRLLDTHHVHEGGLPEFLERTAAVDGEIQQYVDRPQGAEFVALADLFWSRLSDLDASHPITRAGFAWDLWQKLDLSGETARIEGGSGRCKDRHPHDRGSAKPARFRVSAAGRRAKLRDGCRTVAPVLHRRRK